MKQSLQQHVRWQINGQRDRTLPSEHACSEVNDPDAVTRLSAIAPARQRISPVLEVESMSMGSLCEVPIASRYSLRSTSTGFTRVARRTGT